MLFSGIIQLPVFNPFKPLFVMSTIYTSFVKKLTMEAITLTFNFNPDMSLVQNTRLLLKRTSLSALEFFTAESKSEIPGHAYSLTGLSILGKPSYVNARLKPICKQFLGYLDQFAYGDDSYEEKICQLEEVKYLIQEFRIDNQAVSSYLIDIPEIFLLHTKDNSTIEVTLNQLELKSEHLTEINDHLTIRDKHFLILRERITLIQQRLEIKKLRKQIDVSGVDESKALQLLEVWIALQEVGFLDYVSLSEKGLVIPELRRQFFGIFQQSDINYKKLRSRLMERKNSSPDVLPKMVEAFKNAIGKKTG